MRDATRCVEYSAVLRGYGDGKVEGNSVVANDQKSHSQLRLWQESDGGVQALNIRTNIRGDGHLGRMFA